MFVSLHVVGITFIGLLWTFFRSFCNNPSFYCISFLWSFFKSFLQYFRRCIYIHIFPVLNSFIWINVKNTLILLTTGVGRIHLCELFRKVFKSGSWNKRERKPCLLPFMHILRSLRSGKVQTLTVKCPVKVN